MRYIFPFIAFLSFSAMAYGGEGEGTARLFPFMKHQILPGDAGGDVRLLFPRINEELSLKEMASRISSSASDDVKNDKADAVLVSPLDLGSVSLVLFDVNTAYLQFSTIARGSGKYRSTFHFLLHWEGGALNTLFADEIEDGDGGIVISSPYNSSVIVIHRDWREDSRGRNPFRDIKEDLRLPDQEIKVVHLSEIWICRISDNKLHWDRKIGLLSVNSKQWNIDDLVEYFGKKENSVIRRLVDVSRESIVRANPEHDFTGPVSGFIHVRNEKHPLEYKPISASLSSRAF